MNYHIVSLAFYFFLARVMKVKLNEFIPFITDCNRVATIVIHLDGTARDTRETRSRLGLAIPSFIDSILSSRADRYVGSHFGYRTSFERKKQYLQSRLQLAPAGFAGMWKEGGAL